MTKEQLSHANKLRSEISSIDGFLLKLSDDLYSIKNKFISDENRPPYLRDYTIDDIIKDLQFISDKKNSLTTEFEQL